MKIARNGRGGHAGSCNQQKRNQRADDTRPCMRVHEEFLVAPAGNVARCTDPDPPGRFLACKRPGTFP
jgi:hypothetical protein